MSDFKREERYLVVKLDKLADDQGDGMSRKETIYREAHFGKALIECVVIESDWPIYEHVWDMVQRMAEGREQRITEIEQDRNALAAHVEALSSNAVALAEACENKTDLPLHMWAVKCAMLVNRVYKTAEEKPITTLRHHDASILREYADKLEADEAPDAEAGDMWDASQCADWMRKQAEKSEGYQ